MGWHFWTCLTHFRTMRHFCSNGQFRKATLLLERNIFSKKRLFYMVSLLHEDTFAEVKNCLVFFFSVFNYMSLSCFFINNFYQVYLISFITITPNPYLFFFSSLFFILVFVLLFKKFYFSFLILLSLLILTLTLGL